MKACVIEVPKGCYDCPFNYDSISCNYYDKIISDDDFDTNKNVFDSTPTWCQAVLITVHEKDELI